MRVLVTWGSKRGGTEGIGRMLGETLQGCGFEVVMAPANRAVNLDEVEAVIVGGALYANRWPALVRRFVNHRLSRLRRLPVWFFSSGPLDDSSDREVIAAPPQVAVLAERVGAKGHVTFGGRLAPDAKGFPASAMAKKHSGDWRNPDRIRAWAMELAAALPGTVPGTPVTHPAASVFRLLGHAIAGWALCAVTMGALLQVVSLTAALVLHAIAAPLIFTLLARPDADRDHVDGDRHSPGPPGGRRDRTSERRHVHEHHGDVATLRAHLPRDLGDGRGPVDGSQVQRCRHRRPEPRPPRVTGGAPSLVA